MKVPLLLHLLVVRFVAVGGAVHDVHHLSTACGVHSAPVDEQWVSAGADRRAFGDDKQCTYCRGPWGRDVP